MILKIKPESLKPGDMWRRSKDDHWILLSNKREADAEFTSLIIWELRWFGRKEGKLEVFSSKWTDDSRFQIISRAKGEESERQTLGNCST
jgi:hypothetical protein